MPSQSERVHSRYVFPAIVLLLVAQPVLASLSATQSGILAIPLALTLVAAIWSLDGGTLWFRLGAFLGLAVCLGAAGAEWTGQPGWVLGSAACLVALGFIAVVLGIRWLFRSIEVTVESLLAAMSVYLLIGISFGILNGALYVHAPDWYSGVSPGGESAEAADLVYFSLGVLTGTAFGDILPTHPIPRLLSNVEAVVGQMYLAVLVAMLVGAYATGRGSPSSAGRAS